MQASQCLLFTHKLQMLQQEKRTNPSKFVSHWEMDEEDIDEASDEDKLSMKCFHYKKTHLVDILH